MDASVLDVFPSVHPGGIRRTTSLVMGAAVLRYGYVSKALHMCAGFLTCPDVGDLT